MSKATVVESFKAGGVIAYPTEAVFGLGCDPDNQDAVEKLLAIKQRPKAKGLILLAADFSQLQPYIDEDKIPAEKLSEILSRWPNGITQVLPKSALTADWLSGQFDTIAVRVTDHPDIVALCEQTQKPIVSTSANLTGKAPAKTWQEVEQDQALFSQIDFLVKGSTLGFTQPSTIIDALTGEKFRV